MAKTTTQRKSRAKAKPAPEATQGDSDKTVAAQTSEATTANNPASTTKANDPKRDNEDAARAAAEASGTAQATNDAAGTTSGDTPDDPNAPAAGNRHSHPAQTTAEATAAGPAGNADATAAGTIPAGADADPAKQPEPTDNRAGTESTQDESGALQDATRKAIGAGNGAPDGIGGGGEDPSKDDGESGTDEAEVEPVTLANGETLHGKKATLFRLIEKGATHEELLEASGGTSVMGTIHTLARRSGRTLDAGKNDDGVRVYKLKE